MITNPSASGTSFFTSKYMPFLIGGMGMAVRMICIFSCDYGVYSDAHEFRELALNLISGNGLAIDQLLSAYRMPGYPLFLGACYAILTNDCFVKLIQAAIELGTGSIMFLIARKEFDYKSGLVAFTIWMFFPASILQPLSLMSEGLFTFIFVGLIYSMTFGFSRRTTILSAILCGLAALIKPHMILFPLVFCMTAFVNRVGIRRIIPHTMLFSTIILIILAPWILRNKDAVGSYTITTNGGQNLYIGNNPDASGGFYDIPPNKWPPTKDEVAVDRFFKKKAISFITGNSGAVVKLIPRKIAYLFSLESLYAIFTYYKGFIPEDVSYSQAYRATPAWLIGIVNIPYALLILASIWVFFHLSSTTRFFRLTLCTLFFWIGIHCVLFGAARFHYPLLPLFAIATSQIGLVVHLKRKNRIAVIGASGVSTLFLILWGLELYFVYSSTMT